MTTCNFCGEAFGPGRKRSREHAFASWLLGLLTSEAKPRVLHEVRAARGAPPHRAWTSDKLAAVAQGICEQCPAVLEQPERFAGRHVTTIVCGSNVGPADFARWVMEPVRCAGGGGHPGPG